jgi:hypothetical protein
MPIYDFHPLFGLVKKHGLLWLGIIEPKNIRKNERSFDLKHSFW